MCSLAGLARSVLLLIDFLQYHSVAFNDFWWCCVPCLVKL